MPAKTLRRKKPSARKPVRARAAASRRTRAARPLKKKAAAPKIKILGRVVHFYDRISVAIVELAAPLRVGDTVLIKRGDQELVQRVGSMQVNHVPVTVARRKQVIGLKVGSPVHVGALVLPA